MRLDSNLLSKIRTSQEPRENFSQAPHIALLNQKAIRAALDNLLDSLPAASHHGCPAGHSLQVSAAERFVRTGQYKYAATLHAFGNLSPAQPSLKAHPVIDA
jgi:hypothetical protein